MLFCWIINILIPSPSAQHRHAAPFHGKCSGPLVEPAASLGTHREGKGTSGILKNRSATVISLAISRPAPCLQFIACYADNFSSLRLLSQGARTGRDPIGDVGQVSRPLQYRQGRGGEANYAFTPLSLRARFAGLPAVAVRRRAGRRGACGRDQQIPFAAR